MRRVTPSGLILVALAALLVVQGGLFASRVLRPAVAIQDRLAAGDVLGELAVTDAAGADVQLAGTAPQRTLLMVFHPTCAWSQQIAPEWSEWLADRPESVRVLAVSSVPADVGSAYARQAGWQVETASVAVEKPGDLGHNLTSRTPWLFLLDEHGQILFEGHGSGLDALEDALGGARSAGTVIALGDQQ